MSYFNVYTDLDSIMDVRYGLLSKLLEARKVDFATTFAATYDERVIDRFERPNINLFQSHFDQAFAERSVNDLSYYRPSRLIKSLLKTLVDMDQIAGKPLEVKGVKITVNVWPYVFDDALTAYLKSQLSGLTGVKEVTITYTPFKDITMPSLKDFTHVLSYYLLNGKEYANFQLSIGKTHNPELKCGVPSINTNEDPITKVMSPESIRMMSGILLANTITLIPMNPGFYDYLKDDEMQ